MVICILIQMNLDNFLTLLLTWAVFQIKLGVN